MEIKNGLGGITGITMLDESIEYNYVWVICWPTYLQLSYVYIENEKDPFKLRLFLQFRYQIVKTTTKSQTWLKINSNNLDVLSIYLNKDVLRMELSTRIRDYNDLGRRISEL